MTGGHQGSLLHWEERGWVYTSGLKVWALDQHQHHYL